MKAENILTQDGLLYILHDQVFLLEILANSHLQTGSSLKALLKTDSNLDVSRKIFREFQIGSF